MISNHLYIKNVRKLNTFNLQSEQFLYNSKKLLRTVRAGIYTKGVEGVFNINR